MIVALNKIDALDDKRDAVAADRRGRGAARFRGARPDLAPSAARDLSALTQAIAQHLPEAPALYADDELTDRDERFLAAEFIREKIFRQLGDEVPYSIGRVIESFEHEGDLRRIRATVLVDKASQRAILLGEGGARMKAIASQARADMESLFGGRVFLDVWVRVKSGWADSDAMLTRLGY